MNAMKRASAAGAGVTTFLCIASLVLHACTSNPYYIGASCPGAERAAQPCDEGGAGGAGAAAAAGASSDLNFALDLDQSGASHLQSELELAGHRIEASLRFRGETATSDDWPSDQGALLVKGGSAPLVQLEAPFTDGTRAVGLGSGAPTYVAQSPEPGAVDADDFALELVLRGVPGASVIGKRAAGPGWALRVEAGGALTLELTDAERTLQVSSEPLVARAWYHCLFWVSRSAGGQSYCDGRAGPPSDVSALGDLASDTPLAVGGGASDGSLSTELAHFSLFRAQAGALGQSADWQAVSRLRFAELTGVSPRVARGSLLPRPGLRDSPAYLDLQRGISAARHLHLVGPDWPRITCRADTAGVRDCGYLSEPKRTRWLDARADTWTTSALTVATDSAVFADGEQRMAGLVPSAEQVAHALSVSGTYGGARQALSFFARAEQGQLVGVSVTGRDRAIFDLEAGAVLRTPTDAQASIEAWGDGLFRCALVFEPEAGTLTYQLQLLDSAGAELFLGDGKSAWIDVAGLQLDVGGAYASSLLAADSQAADQLSFVGSDGNLPTQDTVVERLRVLLPAGPRLTDQAVLNFNRGGEFDNQVQLYVTGDTGELKFWALGDGETHWAFTHPLSPIDGRRHQIEASWGPSFAQLSVDGTSITNDRLIESPAAFALDRIDVSFSSNSSGSLEGLVAGIEIGPR
jgi:hypothetical protein